MTRRISTLQDHPSPYVTTSELAEYWMVGRKQIYKQIEAGTLKAIRLGPRLLRVSTAEARAFEAAAKLMPATLSEVSLHAQTDSRQSAGRKASPTRPAVHEFGPQGIDRRKG